MIWKNSLLFVKPQGNSYHFKIESVLEETYWRFIITDITEDHEPLLEATLFIDYDLKKETFSHWPTNELYASVSPVIEKELLVQRKEWKS
jgi:hypothetical protein